MMTMKEISNFFNHWDSDKSHQENENESQNHLVQSTRYIYFISFRFVFFFFKKDLLKIYFIITLLFNI